MRKARIMIVDDNYDLNQLFSEFLSLLGYEILFIGKNGKEALDFYKKTAVYPDVIIMDYRMPLKDGLIACRDILQLNSSQKIIFVSADDSIKSKVEELGIKQILYKPVDIDLLVQNIEIAVSSIQADLL